MPGSVKREFGNYIARKGLRLTQQRLQVLEKALAREDHFDADELWESIRRQDSRASRATVYRTLALLVESGFLRKVEMEKRACFEHAAGHKHHDHLICVKCGKIMEFVEPRIEHLQDEVCRQKNFFAIDHRLQIRGLCAKCHRGRTQINAQR
jgi:Fur family transcriptional regulator, ferric uptake regulator